MKIIKIPAFPYFKLKTSVINNNSTNLKIFAFLISEDNLKYLKIPMICEEKLDTYFCMNFPKPYSIFFVCLFCDFDVSFATFLGFDNECADPAV